MSEPLITFRISFPLPFLPSALDQTRQIQDLYLRTSVVHNPWYTCQSCECKVAASDSTSVSCEIRLDLPTLESPLVRLMHLCFFTSKPWVPPLDLEWAAAFSCFCLSAAIFAFTTDVTLCRFVVFRLGYLFFQGLDLFVYRCHGQSLPCFYLGWWRGPTFLNSVEG